jgi:hypothetical protein
MIENIIHHPDRQCFSIVLEGGSEVVLEYVQSEGAIDFNHTYVPSAARGKGLAEAVVKAGLAFARAEGLRVHASCSYVARYLARHPDEAGEP